MFPLIEPSDLAARLASPELRVADVRWRLGDEAFGRAAFAAGHLPGAVFLDLETDLRAAEGPGRHPLPDPSSLALTLGEKGFGSEHHIVVVDDAAGAIAARLWWMLDDLGHPRVQVLHGGLSAWSAAGLPWTREIVAPAPAHMELRTSWRRTVDRHAVLSREGLRLLDARAPARYRGDEEPIDPVAGHVPGASNLPFDELLDSESRFLPPDQLRQRIGGDERTDTVYCGSGVTACHLALAYRLAELPPPLLYPGSWSDWSTAGEEVATGDEPWGGG